MTMPVRSVTFTPTETDLIDAHRAQHRAAILSGQAINMFGTVWLLLAIVMIFDSSGDGPSAMVAAFGWAFVDSLFVYAMLVAFSYFGIARISRKTFTQQKSLRENYQVSWTAEAMDIRTANMQLHHPWSDFIRWAESDTTVMVYQSDRLFNFVPKTAFGAGDLEDFRACLMRAGVPQARVLGFPKRR